MKALDLKLMRDLWRLRGQAMAIALVIAAATATFVLAISVHDSLKGTRDAYYAENRFADVFAEFTRAPRDVVDRINAITGVKIAEGRIKQYATLDLEGRIEPVRAILISVENNATSTLNRLVLKEGRGPEIDAEGEVVIDDSFAKANGFEVGDRITATIYGSRQDLTIVGRGLAPDFIWAIAPGDLVADDRRFGTLWMGRKALEAATDRIEAITSVSLKLDGSVRQEDVIRAIDVLLEPYGSTGAYGRDDHISHAFLKNDLVQLEAMSVAIPPVFLMVSTFLVYIVLSRLIRTERGKIGLLKAFGYSSGAIMMHYLSFAIAIALIGTILGLIAGAWLGREMMELYLLYYRLPLMHYEVSATIIGAATLLAIGTAMLGALGGVRPVAALTPAVAMAPPPPAIYKTGPIELLGQLLRVTSTGNMILRHIARWPLRSAITVFGVSLALGLLFSMLQFRDSTDSMLDSFFYRTQTQDMTVTLIEARQTGALADFMHLPGVLRAEAQRNVAVRFRHGARARRTTIEGRAPEAMMSALVDSHGVERALPPGGLVLGSVLATKLRARAGDHITVEVLEGRRGTAKLPIVMVLDEYIGERAYASLDVVSQLVRDGSGVSTVQLKTDPIERTALLTQLKDTPLVLGVTERGRALEVFQNAIDQNINTSVFFYVIFASAIVVGVVYNSARIIFSERAHELATLRVLGYHRREVGVILLGEIAFLIMLALPIGSVTGYFIGELLTALFSSDLFRLPFTPERATYGLSILVVLAASIATSLLVGLRIYKLDMVRVLKARD